MKAGSVVEVGRERSGRVAIRRIVSSYSGLAERIYSLIRFTILRQPFLEEIGQYLPKRGRILDLGCGFGLFSLYYSSLCSERRVLGVDLNARRIDLARVSAERLGLSNVEFVATDVVTWSSEELFEAIYFLDLVHHLPKDEVPQFLKKVRSLLAPNGTLVIKDVAPRPLLKMLFTLLLDRVMVGMEPIRYWPPSEIVGLLEELGFTVFRHRMTDFLPYPHILYVANLEPSTRTTSSE